MRPPLSRRALAAVVLGLTLLAGCERSADTAATTTTTVAVDVPTGPADEILALLSSELSTLSSHVGTDEGERILARISTMWANVRPEVEATRPELLVGFDQALTMANTAVERTRPADADKAFSNLSRLVDDYVGDG